MSEQKQKETEFHERPNMFLRLAYTFLFLLVLSLVIWRIFFYKSAKEQLAAIEAAHAIPNPENAAVIYNQLSYDYTESYLNPALLTPANEDITKSAPWKSKDYPEVAKWLEENKDIFTKLILASKYENCLFPITISSSKDMDNVYARLSHFRKFAFWLIRSANNDFGEERTDQAMEKYICCIKMGRHFRQQPLAIEFLVGIAMEALGLQKIRFIIMDENATNEQIKTLETILPDTNFQLDEYWAFMMQVENQYGRILPKTTTSTNWFGRLKELWLLRKNEEATMNRVKEIYLRLLADRQGSQILVALRQYKNKTGKWPEKLDEIKPFLDSEEILIDPQNKGSFVYKLKDDSFILYSTGLNGKDENGQEKAPADDRQIWPLQTPQVQPQNTSTKVSDPKME